MTDSGAGAHETAPWNWLIDCPRWLCRMVFQHRRIVRYADYNADIAGYRCYCGKEFKDE